jgi:hypothetical protein
MILKQSDKYIRSFVDAKSLDKDKSTLIQLWFKKYGKFDENELHEIFIESPEQRHQLIAQLKNIINCLEESDFITSKPEKIKAQKLDD